MKRIVPKKMATAMRWKAQIEKALSLPSTEDTFSMVMRIHRQEVRMIITQLMTVKVERAMITIPLMWVSEQESFSRGGVSL
jgi:hypothetical protein